MKRILALFSLIFLLFSCGDLLDSVSDVGNEELILVKTILDGETIARDHLISFQIFAPPLDNQGEEGEAGEPIIIDLGDETDGNAAAGEEDERELTLELVLYDRDRVVRERTELAVEVGQEKGSPFSELFPGEWSTGQYFLEFRLREEEDLLEEKELSFFIARESFLINSIESFPPIIYPNITVDLQADLLIPPGADPFLLWKENGRYLASGLLSEGLRMTSWTAPAEFGIYSLRLELFPVKPVEDSFSELVSNISMDVELFVPDLKKPTFRNLRPEDSYYTLFHLAGSTIGQIRGESGAMQELEAIISGKPLLEIDEEDLAYRIGPETGLTIPANILPVEKGRLRPFTLSLGILPDADPDRAKGKILSLHTIDSAFELELLVDSDLHYKARFFLQSEEFLLDSGIMAAPERLLLSLSLLPGAEGLRFDWYSNSRLSRREMVRPNVEPPVGLGGTTYLGGEGAFHGLIDELGVYDRNAAGMPDISGNLFGYITAMLHPEEYLFATGFDGLNPDPELGYVGQVGKSDSFAVLAEGAVISVPLTRARADNNLKCTLDFAAPGALDLKLFAGSRLILQLWGGDGEPPRGAFKLPSLPESFSFRLLPGRVVLTAYDNPVILPLEEVAGGSELTLEVSNPAAQPLSLDAITLLRTAPEL